MAVFPVGVLQTGTTRRRQANRTLLTRVKGVLEEFGQPPQNRRRRNRLFTTLLKMDPNRNWNPTSNR